MAQDHWTTKWSSCMEFNTIHMYVLVVQKDKHDLYKWLHLLLSVQLGTSMSHGQKATDCSIAWPSFSFASDDLPRWCFGRWGTGMGSQYSLISLLHLFKQWKWGRTRWQEHTQQERDDHSKSWTSSLTLPDIFRASYSPPPPRIDLF